MSEMTTIVIEPDTFDLLQKQAIGGLFKNPPNYKSGKYFIEVSNEVLKEMNQVMIKQNLKNFDEVIRYAVLNF